MVTVIQGIKWFRHLVVSKKYEHCVYKMYCSYFFISGNFSFSLFFGIVMYAYEFEAKEKQKLTGIKN